MSYYPGMMRALTVAWLALTLGLAGIAVSTVASAEPLPPCGYQLSTPALVQVNGATMVTATVEPAICIMPPAGPSLSVACLQLQGVDSGGTCTQSHDSDTAQVYVPYRPGGTYAAYGRGCPSWIGQNTAQLCQQLGPNTATL